MQVKTLTLQSATLLRPPLPVTLGPAALAPPSSRPPVNKLLDALPLAVLQRWSPHLEPVQLTLGQVLCESGCRCSHVHFPTTSIVSLLNMTSNGDSAEVATVGRDGVIGLPLLMGNMSSNGRAVVHGAGRGLRLRADLLIEEFNHGGAVMQLMLRYSRALSTQVAQTAVCNRHHSIDQQVCRLILQSLDCVQGSRLQTTQELLGSRLGVRRESVTAAALRLQRAGLIRYARGSIEVLDREGLEDSSCECYDVVRRECERLLPLRQASSAPLWAAQSSAA
ncbi:MAG: Crp/Fnr family transcriptional regulator [Rubrivivax sp.]|nr:Crp/Fnr family transcriptional regulator [Rubrivivax sp.]